MKFQIFKTNNGQWAFRLKASNGRTLAHSETYKQKASAMRAIQIIRFDAQRAEIELPPKTKKVSP